MKRITWFIAGALYIGASAHAATHSHAKHPPKIEMLPANAQSDAAKAYLSDLHAAVAPCDDIAFKMGLDVNLAETKQRVDAQVAMANGQMPSHDPVAANTIEAEGQPWMDCMKSARAKGSDLYKSFAALNVAQQLKDDGKKVFVAWLAYLDTFEPTQSGEPDNSEETALREAQASMNADALTVVP